MMDQRTRIAMQRQLAHEALAKLMCARELFGLDEPERAQGRAQSDFSIWSDKVDELERWIFDESPIA